MDAARPNNPRVIPTLTEVVNPYGEVASDLSGLSPEVQALLDRCVDQMLEDFRMVVDRQARADFVRLAAELADRMWLESNAKWDAVLREKARTVLGAALKDTLSRK